MKIRPLHLIIFILAIAGGLWMLYPRQNDMAGMKELAGESLDAMELYEAHLQKNPSDQRTLLALVDLHKEQGNEKETLKYLERLRLLQPEEIKYSEALIDYYRNQQMVPQLISEFVGLSDQLQRQEAVDEKKLAEVYKQLATLYTMTDQGEERLRIIHKYSRLKPEDRELQEEYLDLLLRQEKYELFMATLQTAVKRFPGDAEFEEALYRHYLAADRIAEAEALAKDLLYSMPTIANRTLYLEVLEKQVDKEDKLEIYFEEALNAFNADRKEFPLPKALDIAIEKKKLSYAADALEEWKKAAPGDPSPWDYHLEKLAPAQGATGAALAVLYLTAASEVRDRPSFKVDSAYLYMEAERWEKAESIWRDVIASSPNKDHRVALLDSMVHGDPGKYREELAAACKDYPFEKSIAMRYADDVAQRQEWDKALPVLERLHQMEADDPEVAGAYIAALTEAERIEEAYIPAQAAAVRFPDEEQILLRCAELAERLKKPADSAKYWAILRARHPSSSEYLQAQLRCLVQIPDKSRFLELVTVNVNQIPTPELMLDAAYISQEYKYYATAISLWKQLLNKTPDNYNYHENLLFCLKNRPDPINHVATLFTTAERFPLKPVLAEAIYAGIEAKVDRTRISRLLSVAATETGHTIDNRLAMAQGYGYAQSMELRLKQLQDLVDEQPANPIVLHALARGFMDAKEWERAKILIEKLRVLDAANPKTQALRRELAQVTDEWAFLLEELKLRLRKNPGDETALVNMAFFYLERRRPFDAVIYFQQLHKAFSENIRYRDELVGLLISLDRPADAVDILAANEKNLPPEDLLLLISLHRQVKNVDEAKRILHYLVDGEYEMSVLSDAAGQLADMKEYSGAEKGFLKVLRREPEDLAALYALATIYATLQQVDKALEYYSTVLELNPRDPKANIAVADLLRYQGQLEKSKAFYATALTYLKEGAQEEQIPLALKARALAGIGRISDAIPVYEAAIKETPNDGYLWGDYIEMLIQSDMTAEAEGLLHRAPVKPEYLVRTFCSLATVLQRRGRYDMAERLLRLVLKVYPETPSAALQLGYLLETSGDWDAAMVYYVMAESMQTKLGFTAVESKAAIFRLTRRHGPQIQTRSQQVQSGNDRVRLLEATYQYSKGGRLRLHGSLRHRKYRGNGILGSGQIAENALGVEAGFKRRMNRWWNIGAAFHIDDGTDGSNFGIDLESSLQRDSWWMNTQLNWRETLYDLVAIIPYDSVEDLASWQGGWNVSEELAFSSQLNWGTQYLLTPPPGGPSEFFEYHSAVIRGEYRFLKFPKCWAFGEVSWMQGKQESAYTPVISVAEERFLHSTGIRAEYEIIDRLQISGSYALGIDEERDISFGDYEQFQIGLNFRISNALEFSARHLYSTETLSGSSGNYYETEFRLIGRF